MRKISIFIMIIILVVAVNADAGYYIGAYYGITDLSKTASSDNGVTMDYNKGNRFSGVMGYNFGILRTEIEIGQICNEVEKTYSWWRSQGLNDVSGEAETSARYILFNTWLNFNNPSIFTPYIGGGLGLAELKSDIVNSHLIFQIWIPPRRLIVWHAIDRTERDIVFAYKYGFGVNIELHTNIEIDIGYRWFNTSKPNFNLGTVPWESDRFNYKSETFSIGLKVLF